MREGDRRAVQWLRARIQRGAKDRWIEKDSNIEIHLKREREREIWGQINKLIGSYLGSELKKRGREIS